VIPYFYDNQIKKYLVQFMTIFSGLQVSVGAGEAARLISVPIHFSQMDKVSASIMAGGTSNQPLRLPVMSVDIMGIRQDQLTHVGLNQSFSQTYLPDGAYFADDVKTVTRLRPAVYRLDLDLAIWTSNTDQHFQIMEQILSVFNPSLQIQTSDGRFDWTKITEVELNGVSVNSNFPIGTAQRAVVANLTFTMPIFMSAPANIKDEFVRDILVRFAVVDDTDLTAALAELDANEVPYQSLASADDIKPIEPAA
jgi:hypothetical protein